LAGGDFEMKIQKLYSLFSLFTPQSTIRNPQLLRYFSLGQQRILFVLALFLLGILCFKFYYSPSAPSEEIVKEIVVEIQGEVRSPGFYMFRHSPTLREALDKSGGLNEKGSLEFKSSLEILETGALITIQRVTPSPLVPACTKRSGEGRFGG
jgi:hypothetical protein